MIIIIMIVVVAGKSVYRSYMYKQVVRVHNSDLTITSCTQRLYIASSMITASGPLMMYKHPLLIRERFIMR